MGDTLVVDDAFMIGWIKKDNGGQLDLTARKNQGVIEIQAKATLVAKVKVLRMFRNHPVAIQGAEKLTECVAIELNGCGLTSVPSWVERITALQTLNLQWNHITEIPSFIGKMKALRKLDFYNNVIKSIPSFIGELKDLQILHLNDNKIKNVPSFIGEMESLQKLYLNNNQITELPRGFFHSRLEKVNLSGNRGLSYLPSLLPTSPLSILNVENCSLKKIHESFFRPSIRLNLKNNEITELSQKKVLQFMADGGKLGRQTASIWDESMNEAPSIDLALNPLVYPPNHIYTEGHKAVCTYLSKYSNSMINPNDITVMLIGDQECGKTTLGKLLAGEITSAEEIKQEDRTHGYDVHKTIIKLMNVDMVDLGGHREYVPCIPILGRDNGMHVLVLNPTHFESPEKLEKAAWQWVEKILDGTISPHFKIVISKMDLIDKGEMAGKKELYTKMLHDLFDAKLKELKQNREKREAQLRAELPVIEKELQDVEKELKDVKPPEDVTSDKNIKKGLSGQMNELRGKRERTDDKLSKQVYKVRNLPTFNLDCISFISSKSREGYDQLQENLLSSFSRLPKILMQKHWQPTVDKLFNGYQQRQFVAFAELLKDSDLDHDELVDMLKALSALGKIVWSAEPLRKATIFHKLEDLSVFLKAIFTHNSNIALLSFAGLKGVEPHSLLQEYELGHLPSEHIECMFQHVSESLARGVKPTQIKFDNLQQCSSEINLTALRTFLTTLKEVRLIRLMKDKWNDFEMYDIPHLQFEKTVDQDTWIMKNSLRVAAFEVGLCFLLENNIQKQTFSKCCISTLNVMERLSTMVSTELVENSTEDARVIRVDNIEVVLRHFQTYHEGKAIGLKVRVLGPELLHENAWIMLKEISSKFGLDDEECKLECPIEDPDCDHGEYDADPRFHGDSLENASAKLKVKRKRATKCGLLNSCFPTKMAIDVLQCLYPEDANLSPFGSPPLEDMVETENLLSVMLTKPINDKSVLKQHPVFTQEPFDKFFKLVRPVRQHMDDLSTACHSPIYVKHFTQLERNNALVTKGDWKMHLKPIFDKFELDEKELSGSSSSVAALVRVTRNHAAHAGFSDKDKIACNEIRTALPCLIMHSFAEGVFFQPEPNPTLLQFANTFHAYEDDACLIALKNGVVTKPKFPLLRVMAFLSDETECETVFYANEAADESESLQTRIKQRLPVRKDFPLMVTYEGKFGSTSPDSKRGTLLSTKDCISSLELDTCVTHLIHVKEKWEIQVEIDVPGTVIEEKFYPYDSIKDIIEYVQKETSTDKIQLFFEKERVSDKKCLGNLCSKGPCKLFAVEARDKERKKAYTDS